LAADFAIALGQAEMAWSEKTRFRGLMLSRAKQRAKSVPAGLVVSTFVLQIFFFAPVQVLSQNFGEFSVRFVDVLLILGVLSLVLIALLYLLMRASRISAFLWFLVFLSTIAFLESRFFLNLAGHHPFDGKPIDWLALTWLSYVELGVALALGGLFWLMRNQSKFLSTVSFFTLLFLTAGFISSTVTHSETLFSGRQIVGGDSLYFDQFYRLSGQRNVIHIVPDQAQGAMLHDVLASNYEHYAGALDGFTLFTQATGRYQSTYPSVLFYMSGEALESRYDMELVQPLSWEYVGKTLNERSIVTLLSQHGYRTFGFQFHPGVFCKGLYTACTGTHDEVFAGVDVKTPADRLMFTVLSALDLGAFQTTPIVLRERIYDEGRWRLRNLLENKPKHSGVLDILTLKMKVEDIPGSYNYIHHAGAHAPLLFDRNCDYVGPQPINQQNQREQILCTLLQLEKLIETLKSKGVYDQTMIVVNGDHGSPWLPPSFPRQAGNVVPESLMGRASSLLLIKPFDARGALGFSDHAVTTGDIPATIADALGIAHTYNGVSIFDKDIEHGRLRQFYTYDSAAKAQQLQALKNVKRYRIGGHVFDESNWTLPVSTGEGSYPLQLKVDDPSFTSFTRGFSFLERHNIPVRWVDGNKAQVILSLPSQGTAVLVVEAHAPSSIKGQWMGISVQGKIIAELDQAQLSERRHVFPLPDDLPRSEPLEIDFTMGKTMSTGKDPRQLSVLFSYIGLEPGG
jgi:hypothetical protein